MSMPMLRQLLVDFSADATNRLHLMSRQQLPASVRLPPALYGRPVTVFDKARLSSAATAAVRRQTARCYADVCTDVVGIAASGQTAAGAGRLRRRRDRCNSLCLLRACCGCGLRGYHAEF